MRQLGFGRYESIPIENGELTLDPWPTTVQDVKFSAQEIAIPATRSEEFEIKRCLVEFFNYLRAMKKGSVRCLEVRHGLPFSMEIELRQGQ